MKHTPTPEEAKAVLDAVFAPLSGAPPELAALRTYLREQAALADKSSREWTAAGAKEKSAYAAGMWFAYHDVENFLARWPEKPC